MGAVHFTSYYLFTPVKVFYTMRDIVQNQLYQLFISRLDGERVNSSSYQEKVFELVRKGIGGFIVFGGERDEIKAFIDKIQSTSEVPLFIASDIERGVGQQIKGYTEFPCQMAVRAAIKRDRPEDISLLRKAIRSIAHEAIDVGINMPLIPVLDVNQNPMNPIICTRAFSDNPEDVAWFGREYIRALEGSGLISCAKHFPGHGDTSIDSHISMPVITKSYKDLMDIDVMQFVKAIEVGVSSIMVGHLQVHTLDSRPASLSEKVIKSLLREELGFDGLIITDALNMSAIKDIDNLPAKCLKAGVDILLHPVDTDVAVNELATAISLGEVDEVCIDRAVARILKVKSRLPHIERVAVDYHRHKALSTHITNISITLVKHKAGMIPVTDGKVVFAGKYKFYEPSLWKGYFRDVSTIHDVRQDDPLEGITIFVIFSEVGAWKGSSGIGDEERRKIRGLIKQVPEGPAPSLIRGLNRGRAKGSIVISFGSPYILSHFKEADILISAYEPTKNAQRAAIRCLKGEMDFKGQTPVKL